MNLDTIKATTTENLNYLFNNTDKVSEIIKDTLDSMPKDIRSEFLALLRDDNRKRDFLAHLFATTAIEASLIENKILK